MSKSFEELKAEATDLKIAFSPNISYEKLAERVEKFYAKSEEESAVDVLPDPDDEDEDEEEPVQRPSKKSAAERLNRKTADFKAYVQQQKREAEKTQIVTIIDNDSRVNSHTTTLTVSSSNEYFDLGTVILPLNERVEIRQGHLNVLKELRIPQHVKSQRDSSVSVMVLRPRYSIQYEQAQPIK